MCDVGCRSRFMCIPKIKEVVVHFKILLYLGIHLDKVCVCVYQVISVIYVCYLKSCGSPLSKEILF